MSVILDHDRLEIWDARTSPWMQTSKELNTSKYRWRRVGNPRIPRSVSRQPHLRLRKRTNALSGSRTARTVNRFETTINFESSAVPIASMIRVIPKIAAAFNLFSHHVHVPRQGRPWSCKLLHERLRIAVPIKRFTTRWEQLWISYSAGATARSPASHC